MLGKNRKLYKILNGIAKRTRKRTQKRPASGRTCFIQHNTVYCVVLDFKAFDILTTDINNKVHIGIKIARGIIVGNRFHHAKINIERILNQVLAVTRYSRATDFNTFFALLVYFS